MDALRPIWRLSPVRPTKPIEIAAIAGPKQAPATAIKGLARQNYRIARRLDNGDAGKGNQCGGNCNDQPFCLELINKRASRSLCAETGDSGSKHHRTDSIRRPVQTCCQKGNKKGTYATMHISLKEIERVQS